MSGEPLKPTARPAASASSSGPDPSNSETALELQRIVLSHAPGLRARPIWVTWFAHPFANWFWFYFGYVAALSGSSMEYPGLGPLLIVGWLAGHLVNARYPWAETKVLLLSSLLGYLCDGLITLLGVLRFHEPPVWGWPIPLWMVMMWPNFAATLNSSLKWLRGRYRSGAILGMIAGPFSYYGGVKWGAVEFGWSLSSALAVIALEWTFAMPMLLWLSSKLVPGEGVKASEAAPS